MVGVGQDFAPHQEGQDSTSHASDAWFSAAILVTPGSSGIFTRMPTLLWHVHVFAASVMQSPRSVTPPRLHHIA